MEKVDLEYLRLHKQQLREWVDWIVKPTRQDLFEELLEREHRGRCMRAGGFTRSRGTFWLFDETMQNGSNKIRA